MNIWPFHKHRYVEKYGDLRADEPGGPRTFHEIYWECRCGKLLTRGCDPRFVVTLIDARVKAGRRPEVSR